MERKILAVFIAALAFVVPFGPIDAHSSGRSVEKQVGDYLIDLAYDPEHVTAGDSVDFDFDLYKKDPSVDAVYSDVWVRIEKDKQTLLATGIHHAALGQTGMVYTFEQPGTYTVFARYENADATLAEITFEVPVEKGSEQASAWLYVAVFGAGAVAALVFCAGYFAIRRKKRHATL